MHIAEGVLSPTVLCAGAALASVGTAIGLKKMDYDRLMSVGMLASAFFVASLIHIPIGVSSAHLLGVGLLGVLLGWGAFPAILVALLLQALFFQFGGLTVLGINACNMGFAAIISYYLYRYLTSLFPNPKGKTIASFLCGVFGVFLAAIFTAMVLAFTDEGFMAAAFALIISHLPIMIAEGIVTAFTISFLARVRPEVLSV